MNSRLELGHFLRRRREELSPDDFDLPAGGRRRTPGLRRDEVSLLASMSAAYYERLEQGRGPLPSESVLAGMADALRLTTDERDHMYVLAGRVPPAVADRSLSPDPGLEYLLQAMGDTTPACVLDDLGNVVAQNRLNLALFGEFAGLPGRGRNLIWRWFAEPRLRHLLEPADQHEGTGQFHVADLRAATARVARDSSAATLVRDLREASPEFARMWDQHTISAEYCNVKQARNDLVGRIDLECGTVASRQSRQRLLFLQPLAGSPAAGRLARLASHE
jgi:transcriptional regulator with XRE-family HTH domain